MLHKQSGSGDRKKPSFLPFGFALLSVAVQKVVGLLSIGGSGIRFKSTGRFFAGVAANRRVPFYLLSFLEALTGTPLKCLICL